MKRVFVIGDIILDRYHYVYSTRMAQEENIPVYDLIDTEERMGGAANVAANIKSLDDNVAVTIAGISDGDMRSLMLRDGLEPFCANGCPIVKTRLINDDKIIVRLDNNKRFPDSRVECLEKMILNVDFDYYDLIVISDYDKGTITKKIADEIVNSGVPVIVDSKRYDLRIFEGAKFLNINLGEYCSQSHNKLYKMTVEELFEAVIVTKGNAPTQYIQYEARDNASYITHSEDFPVDDVEAVDVTGCGDTHTAAFAVGYLRDKSDVRNAIRYANQCATIAVTKQGTAKVTKWDFLKTLEAT